LAKELGLKITTSKTEVKAVNSKEKKATRVSSLVHVQLDDWKGRANFTVFPMDDFEVILGQEFLRRNRVVLVPWLDKLVIVSE
jgi:hypothetical protein